VVAGLLLAAGVGLSKTSPDGKRQISRAAGTLLLLGVLLTDVPWGTEKSVSFWLDHALFTGALTSLLILGISYLAIDGAAEHKRRDAFGRALHSIHEELRFQMAAYSAGVDLRSVEAALTSAEQALDRHVDAALLKARFAIDQLMLVRESTAMSLTLQR
jgi:hypothetical protein